MDFLAYPQNKPPVNDHYLVATKLDGVCEVISARYDVSGTWYKVDEIAVNLENGGKIVAAYLPKPEVPEFVKI